MHRSHPHVSLARMSRLLSRSHTHTHSRQSVSSAGMTDTHTCERTPYLIYMHRSHPHVFLSLMSLLLACLAFSLAHTHTHTNCNVFVLRVELTPTHVSKQPTLQGAEHPQDALTCRSFLAKEPLIIGLLRKMAYKDKASYGSSPPCI